MHQSFSKPPRGDQKFSVSAGMRPSVMFFWVITFIVISFFINVAVIAALSAAGILSKTRIIDDDDDDAVRFKVAGMSMMIRDCPLSSVKSNPFLCSL